MNKGVAEKIRIYRQMNNMTQWELSDLSGVPIGTLKAYETGSRNPKSNALERIAAALNVYPSAFYSVCSDDDMLPYIIKILQSGQAEIHGKKGADGKFEECNITFSVRSESIKNCLQKFADTQEILENLRVEASETKDKITRDFIVERAEEIEKELEWSMVRKQVKTGSGK